MTPGGRPLRLTRAGVFAVVCATVSAAGHALAGGGAVVPAALGLGFLGALIFAYALTGRERGPRTVLAASVGVQTLLHQMFGWASPLPEFHGAHRGSGLGMAAVHLVVAVLTGWWLYRGESALGLMLRLWGGPTLALWLWPLAVPPGVAAPRYAAPPEVLESPILRVIVSAIHRRGPPVVTHTG
ncbi:hypothetical protein [Sinosporangium siamense]|uniref:Uncharacterized protein n=1 Tax=Sinosporangium siamense TaxID=1367973 RepID=A0A919RLG5_9ACTN|nr:hypothetical protein [Sinosporangium siamense]GII95382.1 hypothetical protein Ssi02_56130 [Sinosporangium siamense]